MDSFYVTTPIYYVNDLPHIGHIYTTVVADVVARYQRLAGRRTYFLTGTDEHGQKILRAAERERVEPLELADRVVSRYHELWKELAISHDDFIRTTEERHVRGVLEMVRRLEAAGDLYVDQHEGWYCTACEAFYTEKELRQPGRLCPDHASPTEWRSDENVFFRLSRYQQPLLEWYEANPSFVQPEARANEVRSFVASGLRDLSVSRAGLHWGIPFPGHEGQTIYVWLDALTNYLSALGYGGAKDERQLYDRFWAGDSGVRLHLVGKDILRFHAVYWPAFLMSARLPLPSTVWAHGWWLRDERKISKSVGNIVRPDELIRRFGPDGLRYFLLREMVFGQDASFSDEGFIERFNSDLANDLGNTTSRLVTLSRRAFDGRTPLGRASESPLARAAEESVTEYRQAMSTYAFHRALAALWRLLGETNHLLVREEPWKLLKDPARREDVARILWSGLEALRIVAIGVAPVMPGAAERLLRAVGAPAEAASIEDLAWGGLPEGGELPEPEPVFPRIDKDAYLAEAVEGGSSPEPRDRGRAANSPEPGGEER